jgi:hypothetical protein
MKKKHHPAIRKFTLLAGFLAILSLTLLPSLGCTNTSEVVGSGKLISQEYDLSQLSLTNFNMLLVESGIHISIRQSDNYSLTLTADDNMMKNFVINDQGYTLKLGLRTLVYRNVTASAVINMPVLLSLSLDGNSVAAINDFNSLDNFNLRLSDNSQVTGNMTTGDSQFDLSSGASVQLSGSGGDMRISASDSSRLDLTNYWVNDTKVYLTRDCEAIIAMRGKLSGELLHNSHLLYHGNPTLGSINCPAGSTIENR